MNPNQISLRKATQVYCTMEKMVNTQNTIDKTQAFIEKYKDDSNMIINAKKSVVELEKQLRDKEIATVAVLIKAMFDICITGE